MEELSLYTTKIKAASLWHQEGADDTAVAAFKTDSERDQAARIRAVLFSAWKRAGDEDMLVWARGVESSAISIGCCSAGLSVNNA